ncbi:MAG: hypothetical protein IKM25_04020 [Clostridia bacterium]|nr:hypothetical protein [Clostridia bacterium]
MFYNNNKSLKQKAVCNGVFSESRPLAAKAAKLRIQLPPAECRNSMRAVQAALRLFESRLMPELRVEPWSLLCFTLFLQGEAFLFCKYSERTD